MKSCKNILDAFAKTLLYPGTDHLALVQACRGLLEDEHPDVAQLVDQYAAAVAPLSLSEMEERYIKTFDLNKTGTLDLGWHLFGEDYNRGLFLVKLRQNLQFLEVPETNELPDHASQVLRVLGRMSRDEANKFSYACIIPAVEIIGEAIPEDNLHHDLISALSQLLRSLFEMPEGFDDAADAEFEPSFGRLPIIQ